MSSNPYESPRVPSQDIAGERATVAACPQCGRKIGFSQIFLAPLPIYLDCRNCKTKLVGAAFVWLQMVFMITVTLVVVPTVMFTLSTYWPFTPLIVFPTAVVIAIAIMSPFAAMNVFMTMKWGRYDVRGPQKPSV